MYDDIDDIPDIPVDFSEGPEKMSVVKPKIGGVKGTTPWTGGTPNSDWTQSERNRPKTPFCFRPSVEKDAKTYDKRTGGLAEKFSRDCKKYSVQAFASDVDRHMQEHGMDSVFYTKDDGGKMVNILQHYSKFTNSQVQENKIKELYDGSYDDYDKDNADWSATFLLNSINTEMRKEILPLCRPNITGPELWMRLVSDIYADTIQRMELLKDEVRNIQLKNFKGENVKEYATKVMEICTELENAMALPANICITINNQLVKCSVADFRIEFQGIRKKLNDELREYNGKSQTVIHEMAIKGKYYTYHTLLEEATSSYLNLKQCKMWGPDVDNMDRGHAPEINLACLTYAEFNALIDKAVKASLGGNTGSQGDTENSTDDVDIICFFCKQKGHYKKNCKKFLARLNGNNNEQEWKSQAPKDGEEETKTVNGFDWYWCEKCNFWRTSHGTKDHKGNDEPKPDTTPEANTAEVGLYAAWGN